MNLLELCEAYVDFLLEGDREGGIDFLVDAGVHPVVRDAIKECFNDKGQPVNAYGEPADFYFEQSGCHVTRFPVD